MLGRITDLHHSFLGLRDRPFRADSHLNGTPIYGTGLHMPVFLTLDNSTASPKWEDP